MYVFEYVCVKTETAQRNAKKKKMKKHLVLINHPSSIITKLSQTDEDVHNRYIEWLKN